MPNLPYQWAERIETLANKLASPGTAPEENRKISVELNITLDELRREMRLQRPKKRHLGSYSALALESISRISSAVASGNLSQSDLPRLSRSFQELRESTFAMGDG